jgi:hypothetical protein
MTKTPKRANLKAPGKCMFCGSSGLSKEHIWPRWTHKLVPVERGLYSRVRWQGTAAEDKRQVISTTKRQGTAMDIQIRSVCRKCNSGWMGAIETASEPTLTPLLRGEPCVLDEHAQRTLATWLTLKIMVAETSNALPDRVTPVAHHKFLMENREPPQGWFIWVAAHESKRWMARYIRQAANLPVVVTSAEPSHFGDRSSSNNAQFVLLGIGHLLAVAINTTVANLGIEPPLDIRVVSKRIWPLAEHNFLWPPSVPLDTDGVDVIAGSFARTLSSPPFV